jgi:hypothetical protein
MRYTANRNRTVHLNTVPFVGQEILSTVHFNKGLYVVNNNVAYFCQKGGGSRAIFCL